MRFNISSKDTSKNWLYPMFSIEVVTDIKNKIYYNNVVHVTTYSTGIIHFLQDKKDEENFDYQEFAKECLDIEMIKESLNKDHFDSFFYIKKSREDFKKIEKEINDIVQKFVEKYNLSLEVD